MDWNWRRGDISVLFVNNKIVFTFGELIVISSVLISFINFLLLSKVAGYTPDFEHFNTETGIDYFLNHTILPQVYFNLISIVKFWFSLIMCIHNDSTIMELYDPVNVSEVWKYFEPLQIVAIICPQRWQFWVIKNK